MFKFAVGDLVSSIIGQHKNTLFIVLVVDTWWGPNTGNCCYVYCQNTEKELWIDESCLTLEVRQ